MLSGCLRLGPRLALFTSIFLILFSGCASDDPSNPAGGSGVTLENAWPNDDGNSWTYRLTEKTHDAGEIFWYAEENDVPPLPPVEDLYAELAQAPPYELLSTGTGQLRLEFSGTVQVTPELTVQNLVSEVTPDQGWPDRPWAFRCTRWQRTDTGIVAYGPDVAEPTWQYLTDDLAPGIEFSIQVYPSQASDIWLHSCIMGPCTMSVLGEPTGNCLECFYLFDMGVQCATNENGEIIGYCRSYMYGILVFAPGVGPVLCHERLLLSDGVLEEPRLRLNDIVAILVETGP